MQGSQSRASFLVYKPQLVSAILQKILDANEQLWCLLHCQTWQQHAHEMWLKARAEARAGPRAEARPGARARAEARAEVRAEARAGARAETRAGARAEERRVTSLLSVL